MDRRGFLTAGAALAVAAAGGWAGCATGSPGAGGALTIAGGEPGGTFIKLARLLGRALEEQERFDQTTVVFTDGTVENLDLLAAGRVDVAPALADAASGRTGLVAIAKVYQTLLHCLVAADSPVRTLSDLVGATVSVGPPRSGTAATAARLLQLVGAVPTDGVTRWLEQDPGDGAISLAGGTVDAMFWWGGEPAPEIESLSRVAGFRALDLGGYLPAANAVAMDVYQAARLPGSFYGQADVATLGTSCFLLCRPDLADRVVREVTATVVGPASALVPQPAGGIQFFVPATLADTAPLRLHPAAAAVHRDGYG